VQQLQQQEVLLQVATVAAAIQWVAAGDVYSHYLLLAK